MTALRIRSSASSIPRSPGTAIDIDARDHHLAHQRFAQLEHEAIISFSSSSITVSSSVTLRRKRRPSSLRKMLSGPRPAEPRCFDTAHHRRQGCQDQRHACTNGARHSAAFSLPTTHALGRSCERISTTPRRTKHKTSNRLLQRRSTSSVVHPQPTQAVSLTMSNAERKRAGLPSTLTTWHETSEPTTSVAIAAADGSQRHLPPRRQKPLSKTPNKIRPARISHRIQHAAHNTFWTPF